MLRTINLAVTSEVYKFIFFSKLFDYKIFQTIFCRRLISPKISLLYSLTLTFQSSLSPSKYFPTKEANKIASKDLNWEKIFIKLKSTSQHQKIQTKYIRKNGNIVTANICNRAETLSVRITEASLPQIPTPKVFHGCCLYTFLCIHADVKMEQKMCRWAWWKWMLKNAWEMIWFENLKNIEE